MSYSTHACMHTVLLHHCLFAAYTHTIAACSAVIPVLCKNLNGFKFWHHFNWQFITSSLESPPGFSPSHLIPTSVILALLFLWLALPLLLTHHSHHPLPLYSFTPGWNLPFLHILHTIAFLSSGLTPRTPWLFYYFWAYPFLKFF